MKRLRCQSIFHAHIRVISVLSVVPRTIQTPNNISADLVSQRVQISVKFLRYGRIILPKLCTAPQKLLLVSFRRLQSHAFCRIYIHVVPLHVKPDRVRQCLRLSRFFEVRIFAVKGEEVISQAESCVTRLANLLEFNVLFFAERHTHAKQQHGFHKPKTVSFDKRITYSTAKRKLTALQYQSCGSSHTLPDG